VSFIHRLKLRASVLSHAPLSLDTCIPGERSFAHFCMSTGSWKSICFRTTTHSDCCFSTAYKMFLLSRWSSLHTTREHGPLARMVVVHGPCLWWKRRQLKRLQKFIVIIVIENMKHKWKRWQPKRKNIYVNIYSYHILQQDLHNSVNKLRSS